MSNESMLIAILDGTRKYNALTGRATEDPTMLALCVRQEITAYLDTKFNQFVVEHMHNELSLRHENAISLIDLWEMIVKDV